MLALLVSMKAGAAPVRDEECAAVIGFPSRCPSRSVDHPRRGVACARGRVDRRTSPVLRCNVSGSRQAPRARDRAAGEQSGERTSVAEREQQEPEGTGPTARRIILGAQLRRLRERAGVARSDAAWSIRGSDSKMSRLEAGKVGFKERDVADLLTMYGITDEGERELLLDMTRRSNEPGWWQPYGDVLPDWFEDYVGLEMSASRIQTYELLFVPGLLQTEDYARAVITGGHPDRAGDDDERRLAVRMRRQQMLGRRDAPTLWAILDEAVLHRPIGGHSTLVAQLERLLDLASLPNVVVQVL